jgi:hypothetical protein
LRSTFLIPSSGLASFALYSIVFYPLRLGLPPSCKPPTAQASGDEEQVSAAAVGSLFKVLSLLNSNESNRSFTALERGDQERAPLVVHASSVPHHTSDPCLAIG